MFGSETDLKLTLPGCPIELVPGNRVRLGRFSTDLWIVAYGWYSWGGNRKTCGWYLISCQDRKVKQLQDTDMDDIYLVQN